MQLSLMSERTTATDTMVTQYVSDNDIPIEIKPKKTARYGSKNQQVYLATEKTCVCKKKGSHGRVGLTLTL